MIPIDLTELISTIISSTSSLVAIIGGFLVSRVITLSSERDSINNRLGEINNELKNKQDILDRMQLRLLEYNVDNFIKEYAEDILINNKDIYTILEEDSSYDLTVSQLDPYIKILIDIFNILDKKIDNLSPKYLLPSRFEEFINDNNFKIDSHKDRHELAYNVIYENAPDPPTNPYFGVMGSMKISKVKIASMPNINSIKWRNDKIKEIDILSDEIYILSGIKKEQEKILNKYTNISGFWGGLLILAYSSIVGIIVPILLLPYPLNKYDDILTKKVLIILFLSGILSLFIYLVFEFINLEEDNLIRIYLKLKN